MARGGSWTCSSVSSSTAVPTEPSSNVRASRFSTRSTPGPGRTSVPAYCLPAKTGRRSAMVPGVTWYEPNSTTGCGRSMCCATISMSVRVFLRMGLSVQRGRTPEEGEDAGRERADRPLPRAQRGRIPLDLDVREAGVLEQAQQADPAKGAHVRVIVVEVRRERVELRPLGRDVAEQGAARPQHAPHLGRQVQRALDMLEHFLQSDNVKCTGPKRERLAGGLQHAGAAARSDERRGVERLDTDGIDVAVEAGAYEGAVAAPDIEHRPRAGDRPDEGEVARDERAGLAQALPVARLREGGVRPHGSGALRFVRCQRKCGHRESFRAGRALPADQLPNEGVVPTEEPVRYARQPVCFADAHRQIGAEPADQIAVGDAPDTLDPPALAKDGREAGEDRRGRHKLGASEAAAGTKGEPPHTQLGDGDGGRQGDERP